MRCLLGSRFSMEAELLHYTGVIDGEPNPVSPGEYAGDIYQDPITGEILNDWTAQTDDQGTVETGDDTVILTTFECIARGIVDGGIRVAGTTERFGDLYENVDFVKMWVPTHVKITKRDRVTNIRQVKGGTVVWRDEESNDAPTIFNVNGVTPLFDAFNRHVESFVLLEKANG